ncbi:MAG: inositol monophosphatase [Sandaracinaceae bacterium]|nr:inositol monophosphatase [Sandaracinaceae bacterium]
MSELSDIRDRALFIARDAAKLAMRGYRQKRTIEKKGAIDLVTDFDVRCEALIRQRLAREFPEHDVVAEEGADKPTRDLIWYVDPIDGTTNFAHGHPFFCVSMGLAERNKPVVGVVVAPALNVEWTGAEGHPSTRNGEACHVTETAAIDDALCATGFPYDRRETTDNNFEAYLGMKLKSRGVRRCGSAAIDLCLVADGTYDAYWEIKLKPWDWCGGFAIALGAGATITDTLGGEADLSTRRLAVSNGRLHAELLSTIGPFESKYATR